jgi:hypothetical protein
MTDQPEHHPDNVTEPIEPAAAPVPPAPPAASVTKSKPPRWQRLRPRSRLSTVAAAVVAAAATLLVGVGVFAAGFALGSDGGGEHHGGGGGEHSWQADRQDGGSRHGGGSDHEGHHGQNGEQPG